MSAAPAEDRAHALTTKLLGPGDMLDGRYRVDAYLGGGGMASVYRATHVVLEQPVAIKVVSAQIRELPGMAQRFLREARAATQLKSEHVARVSDVGTMADGAPYLVMEFLDGCDLDAVLQSTDELSIEDAVDYVLQACEALAEVHGLGIVHRDLKPANLFLTRSADGRACVKLIDFGISRTDSPLAAKDLVALTQPETVMGSPRYMSPEQMEGASKADSRSDIYGIGAVLYELLTHEAPHEGDTFLDIYAAATLGPPAAPSTLRDDVPRELDEVILKCLKIVPAERFADTAELAAALAPFGPEGSLGRADAIARTLEAARSRGREGGGAVSKNDEAVRGPHDSRVRRRASSAHALRRRRIRRAVATTLAVLVVGGASFVGRDFLMSRGHALFERLSAVTSAGEATTPNATTTPVVAETAAAPVVQIAAAPPVVGNGASANVVGTTPPATAAAPTANDMASAIANNANPVGTPVGAGAPPSGVATETPSAVDSAAAEASARRAETPPAKVEAPARAWAPPRTTTTPSPTQSAPGSHPNGNTNDDRLFEDRK